MSDLNIIDTTFSDSPNMALMRQQDASLAPVQSIEQAIAFRANVVEFTRQIMVKDRDYGVIPGTQKPTLLKPGAEKLCQHFGLSDAFDIIEKIEDWTGADHGGEPLFSYTIRCRLSRNGSPVSEGVGVCHSWEKKYRYRSVYPNQATEEDKKRGRLVNKPGKNKTTYQVYLVPNEEIFDLINTFLKMAKKRAFIDAMLRAVSASEFYTQDTEDIIPTNAATPEPLQEYAPQPPAQEAEPERDPTADFKAQKIRLGGGKVGNHALTRRILGYTTTQTIYLTDYQTCLDKYSEESWREAIAALILKAGLESLQTAPETTLSIIGEETPIEPSVSLIGKNGAFQSDFEGGAA